MNLEGITLSEISQAEKEKYHMVSLTCGLYKTKQNKPNKNSFIERDQRDGYQKGGVGEWVEKGGGI